MLTIRLAFRNLLRNRRRTLLTCLLVGSALAVLIVVDGVIAGASRVLVEGTTHVLTGEAKIYRRGFLDAFEADLYIESPDPIEARLKQEPAVAAFAPRLRSNAMATSPYNSSAGVLLGVDPERERGVSRIEEHIVDGAYLTGAPGELLMGADLVEALELRIGDRVILSLSVVDGGGATQDLFRLTGITRFGIRGLDATGMFINIGQAETLMGMQGRVHEFAIRLAEGENAGDNAHPFYARHSDTVVEAAGWRTFNASLSSVLELLDFTVWITAAVLVFLCSFSIINSLFMSIFERTYEFGVARAIGTSGLDLLVLIQSEAFLIGLYSAVWGIALGGSVSWFFATFGVTALTGEFEVTGIDLYANLHSVIEPEVFLLFPAFTILVTLIAGIYPAIFTARISPTRALQKSL